MSNGLPQGFRALTGNVITGNILAAAVCFGAELAAHTLGVWRGVEPVFWPATGMALAVLLLGGARLWPGVFAGILLGEGTAGLPWILSFNSATSDTVGALVGCFLLARFGKFQVTLERVQDVLALLYFGTVAGSAVSATLSLLGLASLGQMGGEGYMAAWLAEWMRDCLGIVAVTPFLLTWSRGAWRPRDGARLKEALCLLGLLLAAALLVFGETYPSAFAGYSVAYLLFIFAIWSALRFGPRGAAATVFLVAAFSLHGTARGFGPFYVEAPGDVIRLWSAYNSVFAVCTLTLAAVMAERQRGEEALLTSKARYHHLFSHAPISIWEEDFSLLRRWLDELRSQGVTDLKSHLDRNPAELERAVGLVRVTDVNEVTVQMFEAGSREQLLGPLSRTMKGATLQFFAQELLAVWEGRNRFENEVTAHTLKGSRIHYVVHWDATTRSGQTDWEHVIVAIMDITESNRLREDFRQAQKMDAVGRLAGGIAHDFNNLIMTIQGYSTLLLNDQDRGTQREELEQIKKAAERGAALTRQLLAFSRKQLMKPRVLNLNDVVSDMNKMLRRLIGEHIQFDTRLAADLSRIKADPGQLEQVIVNLVVNARDAMPQGGRLMVETRNLDVDSRGLQTHTGLLRPGRHVALTISDTGCGMSPAVKAHMFEPFFTTKGADGGTGLGLSTVYGIIKQSGGEILVSSEPKAGTAVHVYLPAVNEPGAASRPGLAALPMPRGTETLLVVEDEDLVRDLLCKSLEAHGYTVLQAACGIEALAVAERAGDIHLLVTDVVMPRMSGKDLAAQLLLARPRLWVLFHSGFMDSSIVQDGPWRGRAGFLEKPFTPQALLLKVRDLLDGTTFLQAAEADTIPAFTKPPSSPAPP